MKVETLAGAVALVSLVAGCVEETTDESESAAEAPIVITPQVSAISEAGEKAFVTISIPSQPRGNLAIGLSASVPSEARITPSTVTFTPSNWGPKTVEISAVDDFAFDGDIPVAITFSVSTRDRRYSSYQPPPVDLLSVDDDYVVTGYRAVALELVQESRGIAVNNRGQVALDSRVSDYSQHAFLWENGAKTDLGTLSSPEFQSHALGMSDTGAVVGWSDTGNGTGYFRYEDGAMTAVPGEAHAINDRGRIAGDAIYADGQRIDPRGAEPSTSLAINDHDHVTGLFPTPPFHERAFLYNGQFVDLGSFGGPRAAGLAINEHGHVVGKMFTSEFVYRPFFYDGVAIVDLGTTGDPAAYGGSANGINNRGDIVGTDYDSANEPRMAWVGRPGNLTQLSSLLVDGSCFYSIEAMGLNDRGEIVTRALECETGYFRAFLFQPEKVAR